MNAHTVNTTSLSFPQHHYPIQVSVTIPQCPFLQSCELSRNMSPGPAQEILVPHPPPLPPSTTMAASQCTNYTAPLPQHHTTLPPPAHSSNFSYPPHLGNVPQSRISNADPIESNLVHEFLEPAAPQLPLAHHRSANYLPGVVPGIVTPAPQHIPPPHPAHPPARPYPVHQRIWQSHQRVQELNRRRMDHYYKYACTSSFISIRKTKTNNLCACLCLGFP